MAQKIITQQNKIDILTVFAPMAKDVEAWLSLEDAANKAGMDVIGSTVAYYTIRTWAKSGDEECADLLSQALLARAETYCKMAHIAITHIEDFWFDTQGNMREKMTAVNKAKLMIEHYTFHMSKLAPDVYGDYYHEIKEMQKGMKTMQAQLDDITKSKY